MRGRVHYRSTPPVARVGKMKNLSHLAFYESII